MIELGKNYRDMVSGFEGICIGVAEWLFGCKQYFLAPRSESVSKKNASSLFFEKQLELIDDGISEKVEAPVITAPKFFGRECVDKVSGTHGMCVGRYIWLFNSDQYVLEYTSEDKVPDTKIGVLDEGRLELAAVPSREVQPEDVVGHRPGCLFDPSEFDLRGIPPLA